MDRDPLPGELVWVHAWIFTCKKARLAVVTGMGPYFSVTVSVRPNFEDREGFALHVSREKLEPVAPFLLDVEV